MPLPILPLWRRVMAPAVRVPQPAHVSASDASRDGNSREIGGHRPLEGPQRPAGLQGKPHARRLAARVDTGCQQDECRAGARIIPNSEKGSSI
jgi:hypothetical protein